MASAIAYTKTQLIKFGMVAKVCTKRFIRVLLTSERKIANAIGSQLVAMPSALMASVLRSTLTISLLVAAFWNSMVKY